MVLGGLSVVKIAMIGVGAVLLGLFVKRANEVGIGSASNELGTGLGSLGSGTQGLLTGLGNGFSKLLNPAFTTLDLIKQGGSIFGLTNTPAPQTPSEVRGTTGERPRDYTPCTGAACESFRGSSAAVSELQRGFDALHGAGRLTDTYQDYYRGLGEFLTPAQRQVLE